MELFFEFQEMGEYKLKCRNIQQGLVSPNHIQQQQPPQQQIQQQQIQLHHEDDEEDDGEEDGED